MRLDSETAARFVKLTLQHVVREFPHKLDHAADSEVDLRRPSALHPLFFGSFDWHSCVHGHWLLARLRREFPTHPLAEQVRSHFDQHFTAGRIAGEIAFFQRPSARGFERPYGWAWLLKLAAELRGEDDVASARWHEVVWPLAELISARMKDFLRKAAYPSRAGTHSNSAFALALAHDFAVAHCDHAFEFSLEETARRWYSADCAAQVWEPSLDDFLSPTLIEAECMRRMLPASQFRDWFSRLLPNLGRGKPETLFLPAKVSDRSDGKIAHLDGMNFSRAWCCRNLAAALPDSDAPRTRLLTNAQLHIEASLPHLNDDYAGEHWLATFATLALTAGDAPA